MHSTSLVVQAIFGALVMASQSSAIWMGCWNDGTGSTGCFCCPNADNVWYALEVIEPYAGTPPWFEFVQVKTEAVCMTYCNDIVLNKNDPSGFSICTPPTDPMCTYTPYSNPKGLRGTTGNSSEAKSLAADWRARAVEANRVEKKLPVPAILSESADKAAAPAAASESVSEFTSALLVLNDDIPGAVSIDSRQWMWGCLSTPNTHPIAYCAANNMPADVTQPILSVGMNTINNLYTGVCNQGTICGQYNGNCCAVFVGAANDDNALAVASSSCGGSSTNCFTSVADVLSCLQDKNSVC